MANDVTGDRLWVMDTAAEVNGVGVETWVRMIVFVPTTKDHAATFQEYSAAGALRTAAYMKAGATDASPVTLDFGDEGRYFNGFKLSAISAGSVYVYLL